MPTRATTGVLELSLLLGVLLDSTILLMLEQLLPLTIIIIKIIG